MGPECHFRPMASTPSTAHPLELRADSRAPRGSLSSPRARAVSFTLSLAGGVPASGLPPCVITALTMRDPPVISLPASTTRAPCADPFLASRELGHDPDSVGSVDKSRAHALLLPYPLFSPISHRHQNAAARRVRGFGPPSSTGRFLSDRTEVWGAGATPGAVGHGCNLALAHRAANFGEFLAVAEDSRSDRLTPWAELLRG